MARILVTDDEAGLRSFIADTLELSGHNTTEARNGAEAIAAVKREAYDILITDLQMPGPDGIEVLRAAREIQPDIEVILITGYGSIETAVRAMKEGAFDYVQKPLSGPAELRSIVERAVEHKRARPSEAAATEPEPLSLRELEQKAIVRALEVTHGNRKEAAEKLGIGLRTLYDKLKLYQLK